MAQKSSVFVTEVADGEQVHQFFLPLVGVVGKMLFIPR